MKLRSLLYLVFPLLVVGIGSSVTPAFPEGFAPVGNVIVSWAPGSGSTALEDPRPAEHFTGGQEVASYDFIILANAKIDFSLNGLPDTYVVFGTTGRLCTTKKEVFLGRTDETLYAGPCSLERLRVVRLNEEAKYAFVTRRLK